MNKPTTPANPTTNAAVDYVQDLAQANKVTLLAKAEKFAELHAPPIAWKKTFKHGATTVLVRREWPGVTAVYDVNTGELLARS
jgi:hypothetical protein